MNRFLQKFSKKNCLSIYAASLFAFGVLFLLLWNWLLDLLLTSILLLNHDSPVFEPWRKSPSPLAMDLYFFNWTNSEEIYDHSKQPKFTEVGPYRFIENKEKVNITWNENGTVTYRQWRNWYFDESQSVGALTDKVTSINAVTIAASHHVRNWNYFIKKGLSHVFNFMNYDIQTVKTVGELFFDGYEEPLLNIAPALGIKLPSYDKLGWFYPRNNSYTIDGTINIDTGVHGNMGEVESWNYKQSIDFYDGKCSKIEGSAGELYPRNLKRDDVSVFSTDMCRKVQLDYEKDEIVKGIHGYKYSVQSGMLDNGTLIPDNKCFCNGRCIPSGMLNISSCSSGLPIFISLPHFYGADPFYGSMVEGLKPEKSKHESYIVLEPFSGIPIDAVLRLQVNVKLEPVEYITMFENVPEVFLPIFWLEQAITIPNDVRLKLWLVSHAPIICRVIGSIFILSGFLLFVYVRKQLLTETTKGRKQIIKFSSEKIPLYLSKT